jgi:two-component system response regulator FixJ
MTTRKADSADRAGRVVYAVDDDAAFLDSLKLLLEGASLRVVACASADALLRALADGDTSCALVDLNMPERDGFEVLAEMRKRFPAMPVIVMTGHGDVRIAVEAMKAGAFDFIEKPFERSELLRRLDTAFDLSRRAHAREAEARDFLVRLADLTQREREVFDRLLWGKPNKLIAGELAISPRTVEIHRARVLQKMLADSAADLIRGALRAGVLRESDS